MKVVAHPADDGGCGHYRIIWPAQAAQAAGADVTIRQDTYRAVWQPSVFGDRIVDLADDIDADVVVLQRPLHRNRLELIEVLQRKGVAVVVEVDDDFHSLHRRNPCWRETNPLFDRDMNRDWLARACERADLVTCTTPAIAARYGSHGRVAVLPNLVPAWYLTVERERIDDRVVVGWTGSIKTHPDDLEVTGGAVGEVVDEHGAVFAVVGTGEGVQKALGLSAAPLSTGWLPIGLYPRAMAAFDVGIVPLQMSAFNEAKSWLKMLEFAALGVPVVASPTGPNLDLFKRGVGWMAYPEDWPAHRTGWRHLLDALIGSKNGRDDLAAAGRRAASALTYEQHADWWIDAWAQALANRDARMAVAA